MRLFVAIQVPDSVRDECARLAQELEPHVPNARWVPPQNIHLTIAFLGEVVDADPIAEAVDRSARTLHPMRLKSDGVGCFPNSHRARVIWVGLSGDVDHLSNASRAVQSELGRIGFLFEERDFTAHLTIGRLKQPALVEPNLFVEPIEFEVRELVLMRSRLSRPVPTYEVVRSFPLFS